MPALQYNQLTNLSSVRTIGLAATSDVVVPSGAYGVLLQAETQNVRMRCDGVAPTSGEGLLLVANAEPLRLEGPEVTRSIKVIEAAATAKLNIQFLSV